MRVLQLIDSLYSGGAEQLQVTYAKATMARGDIPTIVSLATFPNSPIPDQLRSMGARLVEINGRNLVDPARFSRLVSFFRAERFDVIHTHLTTATILGAWAGFLSRTPVVASLHNIRPDVHPFLEAASLTIGARRIIAVGDAVAQIYRKRLPGRKIETIFNPVEPGLKLTSTERSALRRELTGDETRPLILCVGRLEPQKGMFDLLDAMAIVRDSNPSALLLIAGQGTLKEDLQKKITELHLGESVKLLGIRTDVPRLLAASDIFALASHWEGMPVSALEAMAAGLPVVATRVGDMPQIVKPTSGILMDPHQHQQLAAALQTLLDNSTRRESMGRAGQAGIASHHTPDRWLDSLYRIYSEV